MSNLDVVQMVVQERDRINKERERFFSSDLNEKIARYEELSKELAALSEDIARLAGHSGEEVASPEGPRPEGSKAKGPKEGGRRLQDTEVESGVLNYFRTNCPSEGASAALVARDLEKTFKNQIPYSTIYSKVTKLLNGDLGAESPRFRREGESKTSKWFFIAAE